MEYSKRLISAGLILGYLALAPASLSYAQQEKKIEHPKYFSSSIRILPTNRGFVVISDGKARTYNNPLYGYALKVDPHRGRVEVTTRTPGSQTTKTYNYDNTVKSAWDSLMMKLKNLKDRGFVFK